MKPSDGRRSARKKRDSDKPTMCEEDFKKYSDMAIRQVGLSSLTLLVLSGCDVSMLRCDARALSFLATHSRPLSPPTFCRPFVTPPSPISSTLSSLPIQASAWNSDMDFIERMDSVTSQLLCTAIAQLTTLLGCAAVGSSRHRHILPRVLEAGFLVSVQSLLTTQGDELAMLEDMVAAAEWLSTVKIRLVSKRSRRRSLATTALNESTDTDQRTGPKKEKRTTKSTVNLGIANSKVGTTISPSDQP